MTDGETDQGSRPRIRGGARNASSAGGDQGAYPERPVSLPGRVRKKHREAEAIPLDMRSRLRKQGDMLDAIVKTRGLVALALRQARISARTHRWWLAHYPKYRERFEDAVALGLDMIEFRLIEKCEQGNVAALKIFLQARAKHRGYDPRINEENADDSQAVKSPTVEDVLRASPLTHIASHVATVRRTIADR